VDEARKISAIDSCFTGTKMHVENAVEKVSWSVVGTSRPDALVFAPLEAPGGRRKGVTMVRRMRHAAEKKEKDEGSQWKLLSP